MLTLAPLIAPSTASAAVSSATRSGRVRLTGAAGSVVKSASVPLDEAGVLARSAGPRTVRLETATYKMVGVTWRGADPELQARTRSAAGRWTPWSALDVLEDLPDRTTAEGVAARRGTGLMWVGPSDGIEVRVAGFGHSGLRLVLLDPGELDTDDDSALESRGAAPTEKAKVPAGCRAPAEKGADATVARGPVRRRKSWGADERMRDGGPAYNKRLKQVHVHHTVNSNDYRKRDVAPMIRGMYAYHTQNLGWSDIGYNFLVDRFGRAWEGRAGGMRKRVRGAHTLGFNHNSTGIAAIGNFETVAPSKAMLRTIARLAAWKLDREGRRTAGRVRVQSTGSDRFRSGQSVRLPIIDGHRDTNQTACPGKHLYARLPRIRRLAKRYVERCN